MSTRTFQVALSARHGPAGWRQRLARRLRVRRLGELLVARGALSEADLHTGLAHQHANGGRLGDVLVELGHVRRRQVRAALARQWALRIAVALLSAALVLSGGGWRRDELIAGAEAASASASATATVLTPITVNKTADLDFGAFAATDEAGTVVIQPDGTHGGTNVDRLGGSPSAARFTVSGGGQRSFKVGLPEPGEVVLTSGNGRMAVRQFVLESPDALSRGGTAEFRLGAHLEVGANQPPGVYTGRFTVTVDYE